MNNPFDYTPDTECEEAFHRLIARLDVLRESTRREDVEFCQELEEGKMLGVLIAVDAAGARHTLYAFSGQLGAGGFAYPGFVEPVFDYLHPDGYFNLHEREISALTKAIAKFEKGEMADARREYERRKEELEREIAEYRDKCRQSKSERDARRASGEIGEEEKAAMVRQSQFEKAELRRIKRRVEMALSPFTTRLNGALAHLEELKDRRRDDSESLQGWLFDNFKVMNALGEEKSLSEIFAVTSMKVPPSGAGECCAPKLLQGAYARGWQPVSMAEYWYGKAKGGEVRRHGDYYPACRGKCLPVLGWMLRGLDVTPPIGDEFRQGEVASPEILYENEWFCVVDKPSGMLSVPGKGGELSVQQWLAERYGEEKNVKVAHRLDQDTSGLLIATFGDLSFRLVQLCFAARKVRKTYIAELDGDYRKCGVPREGSIRLPLSPDYLDRPRQRVDFKNGKEALTDYEFIGFSDEESRIKFRPHTGRTHQLRVHSAAEEGLGMPIVGDRLYGKRVGGTFQRLHLHAHRIEFIFPIDKRKYSFESPVPF